MLWGLSFKKEVGHDRGTPVIPQELAPRFWGLPAVVPPNSPQPQTLRV